MSLVWTMPWNGQSVYYSRVHNPISLLLRHCPSACLVETTLSRVVATQLINGENHPEMATIDQNIGHVLYFSAQFEQAQAFFENALQLHQRFQSTKVIFFFCSNCSHINDKQNKIIQKYF